MHSNKFECSFLHGLVTFSATTSQEEIVALDPKVSLFSPGTGRDNFVKWFGRLPENVDFKGWEHPVYRHAASLFTTNGVHTPVLLVPGVTARDIPTVTYSSSQLFLVNNAVGLGTAWRKIPGLLLAPCNAIPCNLKDMAKVYSEEPFWKFLGTTIKTPIIKDRNPWKLDPLLPKTSLLWEVAQSVNSILDEVRQNFGPLLQGDPGNSAILQCLCYPQDGLHSLIRYGNLINMAWGTGHLQLFGKPDLENMHATIMGCVGNTNISAQVVYTHKDGLLVEIAGDMDVLSLPGAVDLQAFSRVTPRISLPEEGSPRVILTSDSLVALAICASTLQQLGWRTIAAEEMGDLVSTSISLSEYLDTLHSELGEEATKAASDNPPQASTPAILMDKPLFLADTDKKSCKEIAESLSGRYCDLDEDYNSSVQALHIPWKGSEVFPQIPWAQEISEPEVGHLRPTSSLMNNRKKPEKTRTLSKSRSNAAHRSAQAQSTDTVSSSESIKNIPTLLPPDNDIDMSPPRTDTVASPKEPETPIKQTRVAMALADSPQLACSDSVSSLLAISTLPAFLKNRGMPSARPWALWCTRIAQCFRTFGTGDTYENARGPLYSVLELLSAHVRKESEGSTTDDITTSLHRASALLGLLATEELRSGSAASLLSARREAFRTNNAEDSFLSPLAHWIKTGSSLKGLATFFAKPRANVKTLLRRFQSILTNSIARSALLDIFPEIILLDMSELAESCCVNGDPHRDSSPFCFSSKGQDWGRSSSFKYQINLERASGSTLQLIAAQGYLPALLKTLST